MSNIYRTIRRNKVKAYVGHNRIAKGWHRIMERIAESARKAKKPRTLRVDWLRRALRKKEARR